MSSGGPLASTGRAIQRKWSRALRGEYEADTLRAVPSWGLSVLLHALALLVLALMVHLGRQGPSASTIEGGVLDTQLGDLTTLVTAERAGDPFTLEDSPDPPSLGLEPDDPKIQFTGRPELSAPAAFGADLAGPEPGPSGAAHGDSALSAALPVLSTQVTAPFAGRQALARARLVRREGGTARSEQAVEDGLDWIVRHQRPDGSWGLNFRDQCHDGGCPQGAVMNSDTAATGLALLPLLGAGQIHTVKCRHQSAVRLGVFWLVKHQQRDGNLFVGPPGQAFMYSHAIASMALCEAYGLSRDPRLKIPARKAIQFIIKAQDPSGGGWRYAPGQSGDTSVFGWQLFALRSARMAGIPISKRVFRRCTRYLDLAAVDPQRVGYAYRPGRPFSFVMTAEALVARQLLGWPRKFPPLVKGASHIAAHLESMGERNIYYWYYATQLLHNMKNRDWWRWNSRVREALVAMQDQGPGCARGSWAVDEPAVDKWGRSAGRLFVTSLSILTLEVYYRYLPLYRDYDEQQARNGDGDDALDTDEDAAPIDAAAGAPAPAAGAGPAASAK